jgi:hypothetical protein
MYFKPLTIDRKNSFLPVFYFLSACLVLGCAGPPTAENISLLPGPNPNAPLAGVLTFTTDRPVVPTMLIDDGTYQQTVTPDQ